MRWPCLSLFASFSSYLSLWKLEVFVLLSSVDIRAMSPGTLPGPGSSVSRALFPWALQPEHWTWFGEQGRREQGTEWVRKVRKDPGVCSGSELAELSLVHGPFAACAAEQ